MSVIPISLLINDGQTVIDILKDLDDIAVVTITENGVGHAYIGDDDINSIDPDILSKRVVSSLVVKKSNGFEVHVEI